MSISKTCLSIGLAALPLALLPFAPACKSGSGGSIGPEGGPGVVSPAVFVIDSTGKLYSFDANGNSLGSVAVTTPIGALNGGGITVASDLLYVTTGQPANSVSAFNLALVPQSLLGGSFSGLDVPRGIAYDPNDSQFYVGNGAASVNVYSSMGTGVTVPGAFPNHYGPSGIAFDPDDDTLWVANFVGALPAKPPMYGVSEYTESGAVAVSFDYASQFVPLLGIQDPYAITVCPRAATGGTTLVVVGFTGQVGIRSVQSFDTKGAQLGEALTGDLSGVNAVSCDAHGNVYIADNMGLFRATATSTGFPTNGKNVALASPGFAGLTPPIYGVYVVPAGSTSPPDAGAKDVTTHDGTPPEGGDAAEGGKKHDGGDGGITCTPTTAGWNGGIVTIGSDAGLDSGGCVLPPNVTADTTLSVTSTCTVYDAPLGLAVGGPSSPTLTVGPGVTVAFAPGYGIQVGTESAGGLVVQGTVGAGPACAPVVFTTDVQVSPTPGDWGVLHFGSLTIGTSNVSNLILEYAGGTDNTGPLKNASLFLDGFYGDVTVPLSNVIASNNASAGFVFYGNHTGPSSASSGTLTVTDWTPGSDPFSIFFDATGMLSSVSLSTAEAKNGFVHSTSGGDYAGNQGSNLDVTQTWPSIEPLVYVLGEDGDPSTTLSIDSVGGLAATLTIAAPNTLRLGSGFTMDVDPDDSGLGFFVANGSASQPITFTSLSGLPQPGAWSGFLFTPGGAPLSSITGVTIDSAGSSSSPIFINCLPDGITVGAIGLGTDEDYVCAAAPQSSYLASHESWSRNRSDRRFVSPGRVSRRRLHLPRKASNARSSLFVPAG